MYQSINVLLGIGKAHTIPQRALNYGLGLGGLSQIYGPIRPTPSV